MTVRRVGGAQRMDAGPGSSPGQALRRKDGEERDGAMEGRATEGRFGKLRGEVEGTEGRTAGRAAAVSTCAGPGRSAGGDSGTLSGAA